MRIFFDVLALLLVLVSPYWVYFPILFVGIIFFPLYVEAIILAALADVVYGGAEHGRLLLGFPFAVVSAVCVLFAAPLREHIRFDA